MSWQQVIFHCWLEPISSNHCMFAELLAHGFVTFECGTKYEVSKLRQKCFVTFHYNKLFFIKSVNFYMLTFTNLTSAIFKMLTETEQIIFCQTKDFCVIYQTNWELKILFQKHIHKYRLSMFTKLFVCCSVQNHLYQNVRLFQRHLICYTSYAQFVFKLILHPAQS